MISEQGIRNRELLLRRFNEPRKLRDAVNIVGYSPMITREIKESIRNEFSNSLNYRREMSRIFDQLTAQEQNALIQLGREILEEESTNNNPTRSVLLEYIPNV